MRKRILTFILSALMLTNSAASVFAADNFNNDKTHKGVSVDIIDLGEDFGVSPARKDKVQKNEETDDFHYSADDTVRVSIILNADSTLDKGYSTENIAQNKKAVSYRNSLKKQQNSITSLIEKRNIVIDVKWNLTLAANIISAEVRYGDIEDIKSINGVRDVVLENRYEACTDDINTAVTTSDMIFAQDVWSNGYTGAGSLVAIIDTGTNQNHISFSGEGLQYSLTKDGKSLSEYDLLTIEDINAVRSQLNVDITAESAYKSLKIPFAYNYVDRNYTTDHSSDKQGEHGSHVSGIAAANRYVKSFGEWREASEEVQAVGVAPDAQIITMKVFGKGGGAYDSDYMAAIEDAIVLGADSANLSLGSPDAGYAFSREYQNILNRLVENNTVVCMSAGNSYTWNEFPYDSMTAPSGYLYKDDVNFGTVGSPGSFANSLTVASADNISKLNSPLYFNNSQVVFYNETDYSNPKIRNIAGTYNYVYIDGKGDSVEYSTVNAQIPLNGRIVIVNRGSIAYYRKVENCAAYNPAAVIIANNQDGVLYMDLSDLRHPIPTVSIQLNDAIKIKASSTEATVGGYKVYTGSVEITDEMAPASFAQISDFSSWGTSGALTIKPEITAPGGNVWSVNGMSEAEYEEMSGTSMASPHVAGMTALLGQYIRENQLEEKTGMSKRHLINALLMSTATPLKELSENQFYLSVLAQGSGLANVYNASTAKSVITMDKDATPSYADGKVKAELGEDKDRSGSFSYSFNILNTSDMPITYDLKTDIFTQWIEQDCFLSKKTCNDLQYTVSYQTDVSYDVNRDKKTDTADVQAVLDLITGKDDAENRDYDSMVADIDGDGRITSHDAQILLDSLGNSIDINHVTVNPGENKHITVSIQLDNRDWINSNYQKGCYVEGYTYITGASDSITGENSDVEYSIPLLGFYGSWTDPSMYDTDRIVERLSGQQLNFPYFNNLSTNCISITYPGENEDYFFKGNPYDVVTVDYQDTHFERFAINKNTTVNYISYQLIRNASLVGVYSSKIDENGKRTEIKNYRLSNLQEAPYYYVNGGRWMNLGVKNPAIQKTISEMGFEDGDHIDFGVVAVPEYYAIKASSNTSSMLTNAQLNALLTDNVLGEGAYIHYPMVVDSYTPELLSAVYDENSHMLTVTAKDDNYIAYIAVRQMDGETIIEDCIPEQSEPGQTVNCSFNVSAAEVNGVNIFIGDYARNESNSLAVLGEGPIKVETTAFVLTDTFAAGNEYVVADINEAGSAHVIKAQTSGDGLTVSDNVEIHSDSLNSAYILASDLTDEDIFTAYSASEDFRLRNNKYGSYLAYTANRGVVGTRKEDSALTSATKVSYDKDDYNILKIYSNNGIYYDSESDAFLLERDYDSLHSYIYEKRTTEIEMDPESAKKVRITPESPTIYGIGAVIQLRAEVQPSYINNRDVTWSSANPSVATVDSNGLVRAISTGTAVIRATSVATNTVYGETEVTIIGSNPINADVKALLNTDSGPAFVDIDLNSMTVTKLSDVSQYLVGGGRGGNAVIGCDNDGYVLKYDLNSYNLTEIFQFDKDYIFADATTFPNVRYDNGGVEDWDIVATAPVCQALLLYRDIGDGEVSGFDLSEDGLSFVAVCYAESFTDSDGMNNAYLALRDNGELWVLYLIVNPEASSASYGVDIMGNMANIITGLPVINDVVGQYTMTYIGNDTVVIADSFTGSIYAVQSNYNGYEEKAVTFIGRVECNELSCLYNDEYDSSDSINIKNSKNNCSLKAKAETMDVIHSAVKPIGSTEAVKNYLNILKPSPDTSENRVSPLETVNFNPTGFNVDETDGTVYAYTVSGEYVNNGKITLNYDPDKLEFSSVSSECDYISVYDNEGTVIFAFVNREAFTGKIAEFSFERSCTDEEISVTLNELDDSLDFTDKTVSVTVEGDENSHRYLFDSFVWDGFTARAKYVCGCEEHLEVYYDADVTSEVTKQPTIDSTGIRLYTAYYDGHTDTKEEVIPKLDFLKGDFNLDNKVTDADAIHLLMYTFFPDEYPINQPGDFNKDGKITDADAIHLLMYTFFPDEYPLD